MGSTIKFSSEEDKALFLNDFSSCNEMMDSFDSWKFEGNYNTELYNFKKIIVNELLKKKLIDKKLFDYHGGALEKLHLCLTNDKKYLDESEQNKISISFYETSLSLKELYYNFVENVISPNFKDKVFFQAIPTFRFHFPNQVGYNWKDRYHTDIMLGHPPFEINVWLPFTSSYGSNTMRLTPLNESLCFLKDCNNNFELFAEKVQYNDSFAEELKNASSALKMKYGEYIFFDPRCLHCTQHNVTTDTRISMDIRIITEKSLCKYSREYRTTGRRKTLFMPGNYFYENAV